MFSVGDIFSKNYKAIKLKRYFLVIEDPVRINSSGYEYKVLSLDDGDVVSYHVDHSEENSLYPITKEA